MKSRESAESLQNQITMAVDAIQVALGDMRTGQVGIVLGSGLGGFAEELEFSASISYRDIPGFPVPSVPGHAGKLWHGFLENKFLWVMQGRGHLYEGYSPQEVAFPIRVLHRLGARTFIITNAAGGIAPEYRRGELVIIRDHLNYMGGNPLTGPNHDALGPRFPSMTTAYSPRLRGRAQVVGRNLGFVIRGGVYAALPGPSYETPAEVRALRTLGADLVGMSTALEVIAARHMGDEVLGISCVTNHAAGIVPGRELTHEEVEETTRQSRDVFVRLLTAIVKELP